MVALECKEHNLIVKTKYVFTSSLMFILLAAQIYFISQKKFICFPLGQGCWIQEMIDYLLYTIYIYTT